MPVYEFSCRKCNAVFEELLSLSALETRKPECPECGSKKTERRISIFATGADSGTASPSGGCGNGGFT